MKRKVQQPFCICTLNADWCCFHVSTSLFLFCLSIILLLRVFIILEFTLPQLNYILYYLLIYFFTAVWWYFTCLTQLQKLNQDNWLESIQQLFYIFSLEIVRQIVLLIFLFQFSTLSVKCNHLTQSNASGSRACYQLLSPQIKCSCCKNCALNSSSISDGSRFDSNHMMTTLSIAHTYSNTM